MKQNLTRRKDGFTAGKLFVRMRDVKRAANHAVFTLIFVVFLR